MLIEGTRKTNDFWWCIQGHHKRLLEGWAGLAAVQKPIIVAVNGCALEGCERRL